MRLIDADALILKLEGISEAERQIYGKSSWNFALRCINDINFSPTIYPETQKTGHWINEGRFANYHGGNVYRCSRCGNRIIENEPDDFCKHCGSDNRGGDYE